MRGVLMVAEPADDRERADLHVGGRRYDLTADGLAALRRVVDACAADRAAAIAEEVNVRAVRRKVRT